MAEQADLFAAPATPSPWGTLDWSERWLREWFEHDATPLQRDRYRELLDVLKTLHGDTGRCLACANRARRIVVRGGAGRGEG